MNVLIADDEPRMRKLIADFLKKDGYSTFEAADGEQALEIFSRESIQLVILDVMMPKYDGWSVCRKIKEESDTPVFMLTARCDNSDEIFGFELGADDYIRKPFSPRVLVARVNSLRRKIEKRNSPAESFGGLELNRQGHFILMDSRKLDLAPKEYELLLYLMDHPSQALSREQILNAVWDFEYYKGMRTVDTHIKKLRQKLQDYSVYIQTVRNYGYRFEVE
ncbi:MAG: response regulator transcription factor [Spirochaetales bacterium]|nr:response regulator transcription factor [Spirochaetales bacterium]